MLGDDARSSSRSALLMARRLSTWQRPTPVEPEEAIGQAQSIPVDTTTQPTSGCLRVRGVVAAGPDHARADPAGGRSRTGTRDARGSGRAESSTPGSLAAESPQAVDESLDDLRAEPDPRRAVIAAYARLERVLAAHGLPRKPAEAPLEYLGRMLAELSVVRQGGTRAHRPVRKG